MAREKKRKTKSRKGTESDRHVDVPLVPTVEFVHEHITSALCEEVYQENRNSERERKWSLFALARFWIAVIYLAPPSLSHLLEKTRRADPEGLLPQVDASAEAFFQKCKGFSSRFFLALYHRFVKRILRVVPKSYSAELAPIWEKFTDLLAIDGSRLDKIAHRLKILWKEDAAVLPGCLSAVYDLCRGVAVGLDFNNDAAASESKRGVKIIEALKAGSLILGDRLYCTLKFFRALEKQHCFGVFRRNMVVSIEKIRRFSKRKLVEGVVEDWLVLAGKGKHARQLRLVILTRGKKKHEAVTNVLDPKRLSAKEIVTLYPYRWQIERLFYDLKEVLNLHSFYAANPNAVAMQVYAAAIVHVAFRVAQAKLADTLDIEPEALSPKKLFPHLAVVSIKLIEAEFYFEATQKANPGIKLRKPNWKKLPDSVVSLHRILVQVRSEHRRKRKFSARRRTWTSFRKALKPGELEKLS